MQTKWPTAKAISKITHLDPTQKPMSDRIHVEKSGRPKHSDQDQI